MAKILYTLLIVCIVVQLMFALCDARDLTFDLDNMMEKAKDSLGNTADTIKKASQDVAEKVEDTVKSV